MALDYTINMHRAASPLEAGQLVLVKLHSTRRVNGRIVDTAIGKVMEASSEKALIEVDGLGVIEARKPGYGQSNLDIRFPSVELQLLAVNQIASDDPVAVHAFLDRLSGTIHDRPVAIHVTQVGAEGVRGTLIGESSADTEDFEQMQTGSFPLTMIGGSVVTGTVDIAINGNGILLGAPVEDIAIVPGDILAATNFAIEIHHGSPVARVVNVAVIGNSPDLASAVEFLGLSAKRDDRMGFTPTLTGPGAIAHQYEIGVSCTEPDKALAVFFDGHDGQRHMHILGSSGYHAFVNDELPTYLSEHGTAPGLWVLHNLKNVSWTDHEGGYDADVEGDWLPATAQEVEELFGGDLDAELAYVMEIDKEDGLAERMMAMARQADFDERFDTSHRKFVMRRFGISDESVWTAHMVANEDEIEAYVQKAFDELEDDVVRQSMSKVLIREIRSRPGLFHTIVPTDAEREVLARETNWGNRKPILFIPDTAMDQDRDTFAKAVMANAPTLRKNIDGGKDISRMAMASLMQKLYRDGVSMDGLREFSEARASGGKWMFAGRSGKWFTLLLFVDGMETARLVTSTDSHRLTNAWGLNITSHYAYGRDGKQVNNLHIALDADRAICEIEARLSAVSHLRGDDLYCTPAEDGVHDGYNTIAHINDGVLHREDGPALQKGPFFEDDTPLMEHRFRGNLHREDGPALYQGDHAVYYRHGLEHREDGPSNIMDGDVEYRLFDRLHREDGPAIITQGREIWYRDDLEHREDGPSMKDDIGERWHRHGRLHRVGAPALTYTDGTEGYYVNGRLHNEDGPAFIPAEGETVYAIDNVQMSEEAFKARLGSTAETGTSLTL